MDRNTHRAFERLEIVETGRRRRWSDEEKLKIVVESMSGPRLVSATPRRYGISRSQLAAWRRLFRDEPSVLKNPIDRPTFVPALISAPAELPKPEPVAPSRVEIVLTGGRTIRVASDIDPEVLARLLDVVDRRR